LPRVYVLAPVESNALSALCDCLAHRFGNAADHPGRRPRFGSDMTDAEWAIVRLALPAPAWMDGRGGRPESSCHRQIVDAIRYLVDNGVKWRNLPEDFPPWKGVYAFFRRWWDSQLVRALHDRLREWVRRAEGRNTEPTAAEPGDEQGGARADSADDHRPRQCVGGDPGPRQLPGPVRSEPRCM
jgi:transposase